MAKQVKQQIVGLSFEERIQIISKQIKALIKTWTLTWK
jgi:hypothetical protein